MEDTEVKNAIFGAGRNAALRYEISANIELIGLTLELIDQVYIQSPEKRQPIALIPFHTDAWSSLIASGLLYALGSEVRQKLIEAYGLIHEINSLVTWLYHSNFLDERHIIVHTPAYPSSFKHGTYIPAVIRDKLPKLLSKLKEVESQL